MTRVQTPPRRSLSGHDRTRLICSERGRAAPPRRDWGHNVTVALERVVGFNSRVEIMARVALEDVPPSGNRMPVDELHNAGVGIVRTFENKTLAIPRHIETVEQSIEKARAVIVEADVSLSKPFAHGEALRTAAARDRGECSSRRIQRAGHRRERTSRRRSALRARASVNASFPASGRSDLGKAPEHSFRTTAPRSPDHGRDQ